MKMGMLGMFCIVILGMGVGMAQSQDGGGDSVNVERPVGLTINTGEVAEGYILIPILQSKSTILLSNDGRIVKYWDNERYSANSVYLTDNGDLIRPTQLSEVPFGPAGPWTYINGRVEATSWDGDLLWSFEYVDEERYVGHHDIEVMPNGNILMVVYYRYRTDEAIAAGRNPELMPEDGEIWSERIVEIDPVTYEVVWEWRVWDHLVQDFDPTAENYGVVVDNLGKININYVYHENDLSSDWLHMNAVDYNAALDQIVMSPKDFNEIWIIDHSVTREAARGAAGDLIYRWGNPAAYDAGTTDDQQLFGQHDPNWIPDGYPGAGNLLIFDNGNVTRPYSRIVEITPPIDDHGDYVMKAGEVAGPAEPIWQYVAEPPEAFYSDIISSAQRQPNGNTLITEGAPGRLFEVTFEGEIVWEYYLPPAGRVFRGEKYNLGVFADLDQGQDFTEALGFQEDIWGRDCGDGEQPRLHAYLSNEAEEMALFIATFGDAARENWESEACGAHGGIADEGD